MAIAEAEAAAARHVLAWGAVGVIAQVAFVAGWLIADTWQRQRPGALRVQCLELSSGQLSRKKVFGFRPGCRAVSEQCSERAWRRLHAAEA